MYEGRLERLATELERLELDALLVGGRTNCLYLSGFRGSAGWLVVGPRRRWIITDFRYHERVRAEVEPGYELVDSSGRELADLLPGLGVPRLGFEAEHVSFAEYRRLQRSGLELTPTHGVVEALRDVKEPQEVERIRAAQRLGERVFSELLPLIAGDVTEQDLATEIMYRGRKLGASDVSFAPIVASGPKGAQPHAAPGPEKLTAGAPLVLDLGFILDDYCGDMTRTVFFKDCSDEWRSLYALVLEAKDTAFRAIRPGVPARDVDAVARGIITAAGLGDSFRHGLGHGVGMPFKGGPVLSWTSEDILRTGHVASCEPGVYLPGRGGIRIEDLFAVTVTGADNLNELGTELLVVG